MNNPPESDAALYARARAHMEQYSMAASLARPLWDAVVREHDLYHGPFDKAGRELGVDAAELARSLDLAALIRAAMMSAHTSDRGELREAYLNDLRGALAKVRTHTPNLATP